MNVGALETTGAQEHGLVPIQRTIQAVRSNSGNINL